MSEYEELLGELENLLRLRRALQYSDLLRWGEERGVGPVTLLSLIDDLIQRGVAEASREQELVDEHLELTLPRRISLRRAERTATSKAAPRAVQRQRRQAQRAKAGGKEGALLRFMYGEEGIAAARTTEAQGEEIEEPGGREGAPIAAADQKVEERDYVVALRYLLKYWSVGGLRFEADMRSMGVQNVQAVLRRLQSEGVVEVAEPGVINARREALERRLKELSGGLPPSSLADLFD